MELSILYSIPRTEFLDTVFLFLTKFPGAIGQLWLIVGIALGIAAVKLCEFAAEKMRKKPPVDQT